MMQTGHAPAIKKQDNVIFSHILVALSLPQDIGELFQRTPGELGLLPQVRSQEAVAVADGNESSLERVLKGLGRTGRGSVGVLDTGELKKTLDSGGSNETSTTGGRDQLEQKSAHID
jgi:hypothetical protein